MTEAHRTPTVVAHTPGPWKVIPSPHGPKYQCVQYGADDTYTSLELLPADARLTAAAPDLLALAKQYASECAECNGTGIARTVHTVQGGEIVATDIGCDACGSIRYVIDKAEGRE